MTVRSGIVAPLVSASSLLGVAAGALVNNVVIMGENRACDLGILTSTGYS